MPLKLYAIQGWEKTFENSRSRSVEHARWVPIPNKHDGETYSRLMQDDNAAQIFACWVLLLQVASKCTPRGTLIKGDGKPHTVTSLSLKCRAPISWFQVGLDYLEQQTDWLQVSIVEVDAPDCHPAITQPSPDYHPADTHLPRKEGNGRKGMEGKEQGRFAPPSLGDVLARAAEIELPESEAQPFLDYHGARGWMLGKSKMKCWRSALSTWKSNWQKYQAQKSAPQQPLLIGANGVRADGKKMFQP